MYTKADRKKKHFPFSAVNKNADENEIPFTAENETKTKMNIHFRPKKENESHLITAGLKLWGALGQYPILAAAIYTVVGKIGDFRRKSPFIPETVRDRPGNNPKHFSLFSWDRL